MSLACWEESVAGCLVQSSAWGGHVSLDWGGVLHLGSLWDWGMSVEGQHNMCLGMMGDVLGPVLKPSFGLACEGFP